MAASKLEKTADKLKAIPEDVKFFALVVLVVETVFTTWFLFATGPNRLVIILCMTVILVSAMIVVAHVHLRTRRTEDQYGDSVIQTAGICRYWSTRTQALEEIWNELLDAKHRIDVCGIGLQSLQPVLDNIEFRRELADICVRNRNWYLRLLSY